ncbi:MAG: hypothetical protein CME64_02420 [Halobacteriovoraceae bacterium]|nr:hypothetical protein [Halobacteriovoraceae bacterium]
MGESRQDLRINHYKLEKGFIMKKLSLGLTLVASMSSFAIEDFSCFSTYTNNQLGMVEEQSFHINNRDSRLRSDGYITSVNLERLVSEGNAKMEVNFGLGVLNEGKTMQMTFKPIYAENPISAERIIKSVTVKSGELGVSVPLASGETTVIEFPVAFGEDEKRVRLECGLINL